MISFRKLQPGKEYYIKTYDTDMYTKMIFHEYQTAYNDMKRDRDTNMIFTRAPYTYLFYENDSYYEPEQIKSNAQRATEQMEQRSLNMILKRLINEHFEW